jgi:hypothetical protein
MVMSLPVPMWGVCDQAPSAGVLAGPGRWGGVLVVKVWRWCGHSVVTSATAMRVEDSSTMVLFAANAATSAWRARLLTARG